MSTIKADTVQAKDFASDITLGASGDTVTVAADSININKVQDKGGNTLWDYSTGEFVSPKKEFASQNLKLLQTAAATGINSISFTTGIDSTYDIYIFKFINVNPVSDQFADFQFEGSTNGGTGYGVIKTTTLFAARHYESNAGGSLSYVPGGDEAQSTNPQILFSDTGEDADQNCCGELHLFRPSDTTYVKHFYSTSQGNSTDDQSQNYFMGGYFNTTTAINAIKFSFSVGNFDGIIKMYGLL